jgi:hypothetical protein
MANREALRFFGSLSADYQQVLEKEDQIVLSMPEQHTGTPQAPARYLKKQTRVDESRARLIYGWMAGNLEYDVEDYYGGRRKDCLEKERLRPIFRQSESIR